MLLNKYYTADQTKNNEMGRACGTYEGGHKCIQRLGWGKTRRKGSLGRSKCGWEDNNKLYIEPVG